MKINELYQKYPDIVNAQQLCEMLGDISIKSAYKLLRDNKIQHIRIGKLYKIPKINIIKYLNINN